MKKMKEYQKPTTEELDIRLQGIIAGSGLGYSDESADKELEVLSGKNRSHSSKTNHNILYTKFAKFDCSSGRIL